ncbi:NUDIX hydrolase [Desulfonatronovibrio hydrogenovorans]|uniref:NUDIX hydrolase n=1 Tax=Desulfonatronovibrio hydrogenovorans TaxID=53245 RepID=UPI0005536DEF|nr:NUDIX hydrolase [Desulfonatronovibrio hydrogenovorans]
MGLDSGAVHLPRVAVGAVVRHDSGFLLVRRANAPSRGRWAVPGGKVHPGETLKQAVQREVLEETGIIVRALEPIYAFDFIERDQDDRILFHYVIVDLLAEYVSGRIKPGSDALEALWVPEHELDKYGLNSATLDLFKRFSG